MQQQHANNIHKKDAGILRIIDCMIIIKTYQQQQSCHNWKISLITRHLFYNLFNGTWIDITELFFLFVYWDELFSFLCVCMRRVTRRCFVSMFIVKLLKFMIEKEKVFFIGYSIFFSVAVDHWRLWWRFNEILMKNQEENRI